MHSDLNHVRTFRIYGQRRNTRQETRIGLLIVDAHLGPFAIAEFIAILRTMAGDQGPFGSFSTTCWVIESSAGPRSVGLGITIHNPSPAGRLLDTNQHPAIFWKSANCVYQSRYAFASSGVRKSGNTILVFIRPSKLRRLRRRAQKSVESGTAGSPVIHVSAWPSAAAIGDVAGFLYADPISNDSSICCQTESSAIVC